MRIRSIRNTTVEAGRAVETRGAAATGSPKAALSEVEAAEYIGMSPGWLKKSRTRRFRGVIDAPPFVRAGAKRVVYRVDDLEAWQERHLEQVGPVRATDTESRRLNEPPDRTAEAAIGVDGHR